MKSSFRLVSLFVAFLLVFFVAVLQAQQTGSIVGNIADPDGAAMAQTHVTLQKRSSHAMQQPASVPSGDRKPGGRASCLPRSRLCV